MSDTSLTTKIIDLLRSKGDYNALAAGGPAAGNKPPMPLQARGYQLHVAEQKAQGLEPLPYDIWIQQNQPVIR